MLPHALQKWLYPITIHDMGRMNLRFWHQTLRVDEQMALSALHLLGAVVTALSSDPGGFDRLAVDYASARPDVLPGADAEAPFSEGGIESLAGAG